MGPSAATHLSDVLSPYRYRHQSSSALRRRHEFRRPYQLLKSHDHLPLASFRLSNGPFGRGLCMDSPRLDEPHGRLVTQQQLLRHSPHARPRRPPKPYHEPQLAPQPRLADALRPRLAHHLLNLLYQLLYRTAPARDWAT